MKNKYDKIAKHIRKINELLGFAEDRLPNYAYGMETLTSESLRALKETEDEGFAKHKSVYAFTSIELDEKAAIQE